MKPVNPDLKVSISEAIRTISPPLHSGTSEETLSDPNASEYLTGDLTPLQAYRAEREDVDLPFFTEAFLQAGATVKLRNFPECLDRPVTFLSVKNSPLKRTSEDAHLCVDKLKMSTDEFDELVCTTLDEKDVRFAEEVIARIQYGQDLARLDASRKHLEASVESSKRAHQEVAQVQHRANHAGLGARYREVSSQRCVIFMKTPFFQMTLPYIVSYTDACRRSVIQGKNRQSEDAAVTAG